MKLSKAKAIDLQHLLETLGDELTRLAEDAQLEALTGDMECDQRRTKANEDDVDWEERETMTYDLGFDIHSGDIESGLVEALKLVRRLTADL